MRLRSALIIVFALALLAGPARASAAVPDRCPGPSPCVFVTPDPDEVGRVGTVFVFRGRGWQPRSRVSASFGSFCPPRRGCDDVGLGARFRADARGRFTFRLVYARRLPRRVPRPAAAGGGQDSITFSGRRRGGGYGHTDAFPVPAPSTPEQRADARAIASLAVRVARAARRRSRAVDRAERAYDRDRRVCQERIPEYDDRPQDEVIGALFGLAFDRHFRAALDRELGAYAHELDALEIDDPVLRAGVDAWLAALSRSRSYPDPTFCAVLERWAATGYDMARAPVDPTTPESQDLEGEITSSTAIRAAGRRMRGLGAGWRAEQHFEGAFLNLGHYLHTR